MFKLGVGSDISSPKYYSQLLDTVAKSTIRIDDVIMTHMRVFYWVDIDIESGGASLAAATANLLSAARELLSASANTSSSSAEDDSWKSTSGGCLNLFQEFPSPDSLHLHTAVIE